MFHERAGRQIFPALNHLLLLRLLALFICDIGSTGLGVHGGLADADFALVGVTGGFLIDFLDDHPTVVHCLLLEENRRGEILFVHLLAQKFITLFGRRSDHSL